MKTIVLGIAAAKQLYALPKEAQDAIEIALQRYAIGGLGDVKALSESTYHRLRVGRYRVVFDEDRVTVLAVYIGKRETTTYKRGRT